MALNSRARTEHAHTLPNKYQETESSPERTKIWTEPKPKPLHKTVPLLYYLSRRGHLEHPHFVHVPLSSPHGLFLKDVKQRLNYLRGKGMADMFSWSSKRSYRNGFVWQDLSDDDLIPPCHGHDYVLKGSELLQTSLSFRSYNTKSPETRPESDTSGENSVFPVTVRRRNQSWSSFDNPPEYKVYNKTGELTGKSASGRDAATQTDDKRRRRREIVEDGDVEACKNATSELRVEEIRPPTSTSCSTEIVGTGGSGGIRDVEELRSVGDRMVGVDRQGSGRMKASVVLMQLIACGSRAVKDCESSHVRDGGREMRLECGSRLVRDAGDQGSRRMESGIGKVVCENPV